MRWLGIDREITAFKENFSETINKLIMKAVICTCKTTEEKDEYEDINEKNSMNEGKKENMLFLYSLR